MYIVYIAKFKNSKVYIGITSKRLSDRQARHKNRAFSPKNPSQYKFHRAIRKYGWENIEWQILNRVQTCKHAKELEIGYIALFNSFKKGYNATLGGDGFNGVVIYKRTKEYCKKLSKACKGNNKGKIHTKQSRENMRIAHLGQIPWNKGKKATPEMKDHLRKLQLGKKQSEYTKAKRRETMLKNGKNKRSKHGNAKKVQCLNTGKIWNCIKDVSEELNINYVTLKQFLNKPRKLTKYEALKSLRYLK